MRWNKIPKRGLQLRMTMVFVTIACLAALFQVFLINRALIDLAQQLPNDGRKVLELLPDVFQTSLLWTGGILVPAMVVFGVLVTFRVAGPVYRIEQYLRAIARGEQKPACTLRQRDELHDLCDAVNDAVRTLRNVDETDSTESATNSNTKEIDVDATVGTATE